MKKFITICIILLMTGCAVNITDEILEKGTEGCRNNGGVENINVQSDTSIITFQCVNGAQFKYRNGKVWK